MDSYNYDRLSAQDNSFLLWENPRLHMHVTSVQIFELGPLQTDDGGIDYESITGIVKPKEGRRFRFSDIGRTLLGILLFLAGCLH